MLENEISYNIKNEPLSSLFYLIIFFELEFADCRNQHPFAPDISHDQASRYPTHHWLPHSLFHQYKPAVNAADFDDDSAGHNNTCSSIQRPAMYEPRVSA